jgi:hypothetical protein
VSDTENKIEVKARNRVMVPRDKGPPEIQLDPWRGAHDSDKQSEQQEITFASKRCAAQMCSRCAAAARA